MRRDILKIIKWDYFLKHPTVKAFKENLNMELEFAKNLQAFVDGDKEFREKSGIDYLTDEDIKRIIYYIKKPMSRRQFLKRAAAFAATVVIAKPSIGSLLAGSEDHLKIKGINYDVGTRYTPTFITRQELDIDIMQRELNVIKNQLHCNAVRIYGEDIRKLVECTKIAINYKLQVWLSPRLINGSENETLNYVRNCAIEVEKLRKFNSSIVFVVGNELTLDMKGLVHGETYQERGSNLFNHVVKNKLKNLAGGENTQDKRLNEFLRLLVNVVKQHFKGNFTYAAGNWEDIKWDIFDIVGINHYLNAFNKLTYIKKLRELKSFKKPVAILEFGCGSYKGAENKGGSSYDIVDWSKPRPEIKDNRVKDEKVQADYILNLLKIFAREGIYAVFVYTFVETHYPADDSNPKYDLDIASFNVIKVYPDWHEKAYTKGYIIPKASFLTISRFYAYN